jgi:hypothetical protein
VSRQVWRLFFGCCLGVAAQLAAHAAAPAPARTRVVVAGARYKAGALHRFIFGNGYRTLWTTPLEVEVLDLERFSGGLTPKKKGGGKQTLSLRLEGKDGRLWKFRSLDKDPTAVLPKGLRHGVAKAVAQDQISASLPVGALIVDGLADAAGIVHVKHQLYVMPDAAALGEFRETFGDMLGMLEEHPRVKPPVTPGFERFTKIVDTKELHEIMDADPAERVDAAAFLRARLLDVLIGDYDRHDLQWDWARDRETGRWLPVPHDRDLAFVRFDGLALELVRHNAPQLVRFEDRYPDVIGLTWSARFLDRRHLAELDGSAWQEAVAALPPAYHARIGDELARRLKRRRDTLAVFARHFYAMLAREPEIHGSDEPESATLLHLPDGSVEVALAGPSGPYFHRTFRPAETREVRVLLKGGDDRSASEGRARPRITVRVAGGDGNDVLDDASGGHTFFYDASGENRMIPGPGTHQDRRPYVPPLDSYGDPPRDWGTDFGINPALSVDGDYGLLLGVTQLRTAYGFHKHPFDSQHALGVQYSTALGTGAVQYEYRSLRTDSRPRWDVVGRASRLEVVHYNGFGNETPDSGRASDVRQTQYSFTPSYRLDVAPVDVWLAPVVKYSDTNPTLSSLIGAERPYGIGRFGQLGARLDVRLDRTAPEADDRSGRPMGALLAASGTFYPSVWSVTRPFGEVHGEAQAFARAPLPFEPTLAVRVGGQRVFGRYPFHEAASIGGVETLRGLLRQRYVGDGSAYAGADLRLLLRRNDDALLSRLGIFGLVDAGRVFLQNEASSRWHTAVGGGAWVSIVHPDHTLSLTVARSEGHTRLYVRGGFIF